MELKTLEIKNVEYTPYGELWEEQKSDVFDRIPFRFSGKILDTETALYYYGARYMDPRTSRWISADPAGIELINPMDKEGKPRQDFSIVEANNWYVYSRNNPVRYVDPTGFKDAFWSLERAAGSFIREVLSNPESYSMNAYVRRAMGEGKRNSLLTHSLFTITNSETGDITTLTYNGLTDGKLTKGSWQINTDRDIASIESPSKTYDLVEIGTSGGDPIDIEGTLSNVMEMILSSDDTYFPTDHLIGSDDEVYNCNTALNLVIEEVE